MRKQRQALSRLVETTPEFKTEINNLRERDLWKVFIFFHGGNKFNERMNILHFYTTRFMPF